MYRWGCFEHRTQCVNSRIAPFPARLRRTLLVRGATFWLLAWIIGKGILAIGGTTDSGEVLLPFWAVVMTVSLVLVDFHRRHELTLLHNLGISTVQAVALAATPAVVLEGLLVMLLP